MSELPCDCEPDHFFDALEEVAARVSTKDIDPDFAAVLEREWRTFCEPDTARPVFDGRLAEEVAALPDWPGKAQKRIDEMTLADYRRGIDGWWPKRRRD